MKKDFFKENAFPILVVVIFLLSFVWMGTKATIRSNSNAVEDWLPSNHQETKDYNWFLEHFPFESFVVVSWDGCTMENGDQIEFFAQKLVPDQTIDNFSLFAPKAEIQADLNLEKIQDRVQQELVTEKQRNSGSERDSDQKTAKKNDIAAAASAENKLPMFKSVMTGPRLLRLLEQSYSRMPQSNITPEELREELVEKLKGTLIGPDGKSTALIVTLEKGKRNGKVMKQVLDKIRALSVECGLPDTIEIRTGSGAQKICWALYDFYQETLYGRTPNMNGIIMGGPPTDNVALDQEGERTLYRLAGICALIGGTVALICLRSVRLTMFVFWVAVLSAGISMATVSLTGGTCDSILLSMPALVYVIAMSGAIHLINYYHDAIQEQGLKGATERAVQHAFRPSFFAQFTTAIGLGSLYASHLVPIVKFGFYSAIGVLATLILLFLYLPALLYFYPSRKFAKIHGGKGLDAEQGIFIRFWNIVGGFVIRNNYAVAGICLLCLTFFAFQLPNIKTSVKMMNFFSPDADIIAHYTWLEEKLGPLVPMELVVSFDNEKLKPNVFGTSERLRLVNHISETLKKKLNEDVGGTLSVALFAPDIDTIADPDSLYFNMVSTVVGKMINNNRDNLKDYLAIEGNPSLEELVSFLKKRVEEREKLYETERSELEKQVKAKGGSLEKLMNQYITEYEYQSRSSKNTMGDNPFIEQIRKLYETQQELHRCQYRLSSLEDERDSLEASGIHNLHDLLATIPADRPFRTLSLEQTLALRAGAEDWQRSLGIDLWRISIRVWALKKDIDYSKFIDDVKNVVEPILAETSGRLEKILNGTETKKAALDNKEKALKDLKNETALASGLSSSEDVGPSQGIGRMQEGHGSDIVYPAGISAKYTGMVPLVYKTQHELINGLVQSLLWAFVLIALVIVFLYKNFVLSIVAMLPNVFPIVAVFGYMAWKGVLVDVGTMMTASVALGVAVDDTIHYITWYTQALDQGATVKDAARFAYRRCATAMTQSSLISGLGLFAFAFSTFVPTQRFGMMMLAILFVALIGDLIFLPSLLSGPIGRLYAKNRVSRRKS